MAGSLIVVMISTLVALVMLRIEALAPGRQWPHVAGWWWRALTFNAVQVGIVWMAGITWDCWMIRHRFWSIDRLGVLGGAIVGYVVITFGSYWWHRWRHKSSFLWRWFHQLHHSPQRIEVATAFYKHPFEALTNSLLFSAVLYLLLGLAPPAASATALMLGVVELFYHWNVKTPRWLGFIVQRPESHCIHHQSGLHTYNYSDLPVWDMLFGTFRNPPRWEGRCGFGKQEHSSWQMLRGFDVGAR